VLTIDILHLPNNSDDDTAVGSTKHILRD